MMTEISQNIINDCSDIGTVSFFAPQSDWDEHFGIVDGQVIRFQCVQGDPHQITKPVWGQFHCL